MPVERKPLFRAEILAPRAAALSLGSEAEQARDVLRKWARLLGSARAEELTESELLPDFLTDIFCGLALLLTPQVCQKCCGYLRSVFRRIPLI